jgi:DNA topoisomerase-1
MPKSLVIVESPAKAKTINKFLGRNYIVKASMGNIRDLPPKGLAVDIENDFTPQYATIRGKSKVIKELQTAAKDVDSIYLATDPDREGEAIGWHLAYVLRNLKKPIHRVTFNEITKNAVTEAIKHPTDIKQNLVDAQKARRVLDRLVGYQISPILWKNIKGGLSAGRVQSVAVRLICEREAEIEAFVPQEYWSITAKLKGEKTAPFEARLFKIGSKKADIQSYGFFITEEEAKAIVEDAKDKQFIVKDVVRKERKRYPVPPFITSTLQQEAAGKLHFPAKKTMLIAQQLYEGLEIGDEGSVGLITYMRTDSTRIADEALAAVRDFIKNSYGKEYLPAEAVHYKSKKGAQDAHEAIRPTYMDKPPEAIKNFLNDDQYKLYDLIWKRFVASQMNPAILDVTTVDISAGKYIFRATGSIIKFKGFMLVYMEGKDESAEEEETEKEIILPELTVGELLELLGLLPKQHFTQPPPRYSERSLVKELEEKGIGRPSTYAAIISTIQDRDYVVKESGRFMPTEVGKMVNQALIKSFPNILDVQFTATMENTLDNVEDGKADWVGVLREFYTPFSKSLEAAPDTIYNAKKEMEEVSEEVCEKCGKPMIVKWGRYGQFLGCSGYPECKNIKPYHRVAKGQEGKEARGQGGDEPQAGTLATNEICDKCGKPMVIKTSRAGGKFLACTGYPECKNAKSISTGVNCPEPNCNGYIGERRSKRGRIFYGCSRYPDCKFALWDKPVPKSCPKCGATFLVEKTSKAKGQYLACANKKCGYTE